MEDIENYWGEKLIKVLVKPNDDFISPSDGILADEIIFLFENFQLKISAIVDTDEIDLKIIERENSKIDNSYIEHKTLNNFIGKRLSQTWECFNSKNYFDLFIIGFVQLHPNLMILSEGSSLKIFNTTELKK